MLSYTTQSEREQEEIMKQSLDDEFIIDPETGAKLTLEQAESGHWLTHDNESKEITEDAISKLSYEDE
jgi:hypothetical protein